MKKTLVKYDHSSDKYEKPSVTVDLVVFTEKKGHLYVLLIKRAHAPFARKWALPGGYLDVARKESLEQAAERELYEETHLKNICLQQLRTYGDPDRDPRGRVITVAYYAFVPYEKAKKMTRAGDDAAEAKWFCSLHLPKLAFDHDKILRDAIARI